jgi:hypothetical protein
MPGEFAISSAKSRFHISIDFGTHGSGFAYSAVGDVDDRVQTCEQWEGMMRQPTPKTRTALLYRRSDLSKPCDWGWSALNFYAALPESERQNYLCLEHFKLYLMPEQWPELAPLPAGLSPKKLVADFLTCMFSLINSTMDAHYGKR